MNILGIRPDESFYKYLTVQQKEDRGLQIQRSKQNTEECSDTTRNMESIGMDNSDIKEKQRFSAMDYATMYNPDEKHELKGRDSDIETLDVRSAISEMNRDAVLKQYQFFVGDCQEVEKKILSLQPTENFTVC